MAKMLKHLVFGHKKNPPAPPRPDYEGDKSRDSTLDHAAPFPENEYENVPRAKRGTRVRFDEEEESKLVVFEEYSEPADLRAEMSTLEADPLYTSPVDDRATAPPLSPDGAPEDEEDMYCVPYDEEESPPHLPEPCLAPGRPPDRSSRREEQEESTYDLVPDEDGRSDEEREEEDEVPPYEYDEPWEWSVGARLTTSLQVSPTSSSLGDEEEEEEEDGRRGLVSELDPEEEEDMTTARPHRRRLLLYETAFDSRVRREAADDVDGLVRVRSGPLHLGGPTGPNGEGGHPARAASRSSFGSTSGSSASSTPTHQPMEIARQSPVARHPFTPTERRRVTLVRDPPARSTSPQARASAAAGGAVINQNFERKISFVSGGQQPVPWDDPVSRSSDRSSSRESVNLELHSGPTMGRRSASRDGLHDDAKRTTLAESHLGLKVLPTDVSPLFSRPKSSKSSCDLATATQQPQDPELKENDSADANAPRKQSSTRRPSEVRSTPADVPQSPENDERSSGDYDPPWDLKATRSGAVPRPSVNGSVSVPERLYSGGGQSSPTTSVTHDPLDACEEEDRAAHRPNRPNGLPSSRPNLNLNLSSDSPVRKGRQNLTLNFGCAALGAIGEKVDPQLTLEKQGWYHGSISRVDAEGKLRVLKEGSYLVRNSESSKQDYSLSLKSARGFMHMKIVPTSEGRFILGQFSNPFSSIPEMIQHYSVNKLPIKGAEHMSLLYPVIDQLL